MQQAKKFFNDANKGWLLIIAGGICEIFWVSGLKYADTLFLYCLVIIGVSFSFYCAITAFKFIEVSVGYAVFVGIGAAGIVVAEMFVFSEEIRAIKIFLICTLLCGVIGLKFVDKPRKLESKCNDSGHPTVQELEVNLANNKEHVSSRDESKND